MNKFLTFILSVILCQSAGFIGSIFTRMSVSTWYQDIVKPPFNPPSWVFAPVWSLLFLLMGTALFLVWETKGSRYRKPAVWIFMGQLFFNIMWSAAFFGLRSPFLGIQVIIILLALIVLTIRIFGRVSKTAAYLLVPYLVWVSFATVLNISLYMLNR